MLAPSLMFSVSVVCSLYILFQKKKESYFGTHYFYSILGVQYRLPEGTKEHWCINHVPIVMYLLYVSFFVQYTTSFIRPFRSLSVSFCFFFFSVFSSLFFPGAPFPIYRIYPGFRIFD